MGSILRLNQPPLLCLAPGNCEIYCENQRYDYSTNASGFVPSKYFFVRELVVSEPDF